MQQLPNDARTTLLPELWRIQQKKRHIPEESIAVLADTHSLSAIEVQGVVSFYHFLHNKPAGKYTIYVNDSIISECRGYTEVVTAFEQATGAKLGGTDPSATFGLYATSCIGMSDQEPAALINFLPFTELTPARVKALVAALKSGERLVDLFDEPETACYTLSDGEEPIFLRSYQAGELMGKIEAWDGDQILDAISQADLRGMGGAFFPTALKWAACKKEPSHPKYLICNADEGEPGTFKDRILLAQYPGLLLEGMLLAAKATGATAGIIYVRAEYRYLKPLMEETLRTFREAGWLGDGAKRYLGRAFDIQLAWGAGAYICGEETALIESLEGKRGEPRIKQYYPTQRGYLQQPTVVNNVETFCAAARIVELGVENWVERGTDIANGHKLLSVSGDCNKPGIYEIPWGMSLGKLMDACEANDPYFVQITGPSGTCVRANERDRVFSFGDLRCGGAVMLFNSQRQPIRILENFAQFFVRESCGVCTPCRAGNTLLARQLRKVAHGMGQPQDLEAIQQWGSIIMKSSRCGLGKTSPNTLLEALQQFPEAFTITSEETQDANFDIARATESYERIIHDQYEG